MSMNVQRQKKGFSIMETMIASFVLVVGLVGVITIFGPAVENNSTARYQMTAAALAQEGVELVKNVRDNDMLEGDFDASLSSSGTYCMDYNDAEPSSCTSDGRLYMSGDFYVHGAGTASNFKRKIYIVVGSSDISIKSYVVWGDGSFPAALNSPAMCTLSNQCVFSQTILTNWK